MNYCINFDAMEGKQMRAGNYMAPVGTGEKMKEAFQLVDGDGRVCFYGRSDEKGFEPLDGYGESFGCTGIRFLDEYHEWVAL